MWKKKLHRSRQVPSVHQMEVGKGGRVKFWQDSWLEGRALGDQYPHIFVITQQKDIMINDSSRDAEEGREVADKCTEKLQQLGD